MKKKRIISSISGVITNSSSEVFLIDLKDTGFTEKTFIEFLESILKADKERNQGSGMAGILELENWDSLYERFCKLYIPGNKSFTLNDFLKFWPVSSIEEARERFFKLNVDEGFLDIIDEIERNYSISSRDLGIKSALGIGDDYECFDKLYE